MAGRDKTSYVSIQRSEMKTNAIEVSKAAHRPSVDHLPNNSYRYFGYQKLCTQFFEE